MYFVVLPPGQREMSKVCPCDSRAASFSLELPPIPKLLPLATV